MVKVGTMRYAEGRTKGAWHMDAQKTGAYLAALRKARGLTQQEIAGRLGISRSYVYRHIYCK